MASNLTHTGGFTGSSPSVSLANMYGAGRYEPSMGHAGDAAATNVRTLNDFAMAQYNQDIWKEQFGLQTDWEQSFFDYQFNKENEYNLPVNQLQRLIDAGINPLDAVQALTGGASSSPGVSSPSPSGGSASGGQSFSNGNDFAGVDALNSIASQFGETGLKFSQMKNLDADTSIRKQRAPFDFANIQSSTEYNDALKNLTGWQSAQIEKMLPLISSGAELDNKLKELESVTKHFVNQQAYYQAQMLRKDYEWYDANKVNEYNKGCLEIDNLRKDLDVKTNEIQVGNSIIAVNATQEDVNRSIVELNGKQCIFIDKQGCLVDAQRINQLAEAHAKRLNNIHSTLLGSDTPYGVVAASYLGNLDAKGYFDEVGKLTSEANKIVLDGLPKDDNTLNGFPSLYPNNSSAVMNYMAGRGNFEIWSADKAVSLARQGVAQSWINTGCNVVEAGASVVGAAGTIQIGGAAMMNATGLDAQRNQRPVQVHGFSQ